MDRAASSPGGPQVEGAVRVPQVPRAPRAGLGPPARLSCASSVFSWELLRGCTRLRGPLRAWVPSGHLAGGGASALTLRTHSGTARLLVGSDTGWAST